MPHQESMTVIDRIKPGHTEALKELLGTISEHGDAWNVIPFQKFSTVHFARLVVFDEAKDLEGNVLPPLLALLTNVDAPMDSHIRELATVAGEGLDQVFGHCQGFPEPVARTPESRMAYLRQHMKPSSAFYVNRRGRSVRQIRQEEGLRQAINSFLDSQDFSGRDPMHVRAAIQTFVRSKPELEWTRSAAEQPELWWRITETLHMVFVIVAGLILSPILVALFPLWLILLRYRETHDVPDGSRAAGDEIRKFRADEDYGGQNQIIAIGLFKPGWFRRITTMGILLMTDYAARHIYNRGSLAGLNTIHFARWVAVDDNRRMFFSSNYDGSLESYMSDFIDKAAWGLNAIFSNGDGFPRTAYLFCGGITDEQAYKRFLPTRQVESRVWYGAYKGLSTKNLANNSEIRNGLFAQLNQSDTEAWLRRFGVGKELPKSGLVARLFDAIRWDRICRHSN